jgi:hypothetical protein
VADNLDKFDITESESLLIGKNFGVTTDIQTGLDGNLYVVSLSNGAVYQIYASGSSNLQQTAPSKAASFQDSTLWWRFRSGTASSLHWAASAADAQRLLELR